VFENYILHYRDFGIMFEDAAKRALPRYYAILGGEAVPRYRLAKLLPVKVDLKKADMEKLWDVHDDALKKYYKKFAPDLKLEIMTDVKTVKPPKTSLLDLKLELARRIFQDCQLCERRCKAARPDQVGHCGVADSRISSEFMHHGEETELVPSYTFFFAGCTFNCVYCQNWDISQNPNSGLPIEARIVARMLKKQSSRARNANWVGGDPTSNLAFILEVLTLAEVELAQVWNSNMYLTEESMKLLDGVIDVYLTDFKYGNNDCGERLSNVKSYWDIITRNHKLANEQTEIIIRHLVLPNHVECCTEPVMKWIAGKLDTSSVRVNVMDQYRPEWHAFDHDDIDRRLKLTEYTKAVGIAAKLKLNLCD
jgi:putative pyruvate formate lyase activating enzyme